MQGHSFKSGENDSSVDLEFMIYIDTENPEAVLSGLASSLGGVVRNNELIVSSVRLVSAHNDYQTGRGVRANFLEWSSVLEGEAMPGLAAQDVVAIVGDMLEAVWKSGYRAVATSDYEEQLPYSGGMQLYSAPPQNIKSKRRWWEIRRPH